MPTETGLGFGSILSDLGSGIKDSLFGSSAPKMGITANGATGIMNDANSGLGMKAIDATSFAGMDKLGQQSFLDAQAAHKPTEGLLQKALTPDGLLAGMKIYGGMKQQKFYEKMYADQKKRQAKQDAKAEKDSKARGQLADHLSL